MDMKYDRLLGMSLKILVWMGRGVGEAGLALV